MADGMVIQGRQWSESALEGIRNLMIAHPDWGRTRISVELCRQWDWHNQQGRLKDMAARTLLLKLERAGHLRLPRRRRKQSKARNLLGCFRDHPDGILACMGNSAGGTVTFYAACVDERISLAVVSCSFCSYAQSWMKHHHCACGYLPGILNYADMGDLGGLIAPRRFIIVAGKEDPLADISGVQVAFNRSREVFKAMGCEQNASLLIGDGGHQFYPKLAWPEIAKASKIK